MVCEETEHQEEAVLKSSFVRPMEYVKKDVWCQGSQEQELIGVIVQKEGNVSQLENAVKVPLKIPQQLHQLSQLFHRQQLRGQARVSRFYSQNRALCINSEYIRVDGFFFLFVISRYIMQSKGSIRRWKSQRNLPRTKSLSIKRRMQAILPC